MWWLVVSSTHGHLGRFYHLVTMRSVWLRVFPLSFVVVAVCVCVFVFLWGTFLDGSENALCQFHAEVFECFPCCIQQWLQVHPYSLSTVSGPASLCPCPHLLLLAWLHEAILVA